MIADSEELPAPSTLDAIMPAPENRDTVAFLVSVAEAADRAVRVQYNLARTAAAPDRRTRDEPLCISGSRRRALLCERAEAAQQRQLRLPSCRSSSQLPRRGRSAERRILDRSGLNAF